MKQTLLTKLAGCLMIAFMLASCATNNSTPSTISTGGAIVQSGPNTTPEPTICQAGVVEQSFEHGFMFWLGRTLDERCKTDHSFEKGSGVIWVVILDSTGRQGTWLIQPDNWDPAVDSESDAKLTPPEGLLQPVRGFGKIWRELPKKEQRSLGWATGEELPFTSGYRYDPGGYIDLSGNFVLRPGKHTMSGLAGDTFAFDELSQTVTYLPPG